MIAAIVKFWRWLWPHDYADMQTCMRCMERKHRDRMYHDPVYGWFCTKEEYEDAWLQSQV